MAGYILHLTEEENITLAAPVVRRLVEGGNGDAALLYLCLVRARGASAPEKLRAELRWSEEQFAAAERALADMGLVSAPTRGIARETVPERGIASESERKSGISRRTVPTPAVEDNTVPEYSREDVIGKLESDASFAGLLGAVEQKLGRLSDPSVRKLLGLYDFLGLPADVVYLLVNYCIDRKAEQFGAGRLPTMREIEKEGYVWARRELFSTAAANAYIKNEQSKRRSFPEYMAVLRLGGRAAAPSEERYLGAWAEMGFPPETVAVAYDKTMLHCHELKWPYLNGILKRWHEKGLHTPDEVNAENATPKKTAKSGGKNAWMRDYE